MYNCKQLFTELLGAIAVNVELSADALQFVESLVATGQYPTAKDAVADGVKLLMARNKLREEIRVGLEDAENGRLIEHDDVFAELRAKAAQFVNSSEGGS